MSAGLFSSYRVMWMPLDLEWRPATAAVRHCCKEMAAALEHACDQHATPFECPDTVLVYHQPFNEYGIPIRDGSASYLVVTHCPWCGVSLPESAREAWFDETDGLGLSDAPLEALPAKYLTKAWRTPGAS